MAKWVISVAGIAILSVLSDVVLPAGQTRKYVKTVVSVVVTVVLAQPLLTFASSGKIAWENTVPQQHYLQYVSQSQPAVDATLLQERLADAGFCSPSVSYQGQTQTYFVAFTEAYSPQLAQKAYQVSWDCLGHVVVKFSWNE